MDELVPPHYLTPKIALFSGVEDPENHLTTFKALMIILLKKSFDDSKSP